MMEHIDIFCENDGKHYMLEEGSRISDLLLPGPGLLSVFRGWHSIILSLKLRVLSVMAEKQPFVWEENTTFY